MMKNTRKIKRQKVREKIAEVSPWELSGSPEDICKELRDTQNAYLDKYNQNDILESGWTWETSNYDDSGDGEFVLEIIRLENDKEYDTRVKTLMKIKEKEELVKAKEEKAEYDEYLRLKQKFGDNYLHKKFDDQNWNPTPKPDFSGY